MYQNAKLYLNSDKTGFKKVSKNWQRLHLWQIFVIFLSQKWNIVRKYSHTKTNKNMTKLYFCYIFDTILVRLGNIMETFQSKKVTKMCQNPFFDSFFMSYLITYLDQSYFPSHPTINSLLRVSSLSLRLILLLSSNSLTKILELSYISLGNSIILLLS